MRSFPVTSGTCTQQPQAGHGAALLLLRPQTQPDEWGDITSQPAARVLAGGAIRGTSSGRGPQRDVRTWPTTAGLTGQGRSGVSEPGRRGPDLHSSGSSWI